MILLEILPRRKHLTELKFSEDYIPFGAKTGPTGLTVISTEYCEELSLKTGMEFTPDEIDGMYAESECRRAKSKALWYLSTRSFCSGELLKKLRREFSSEAAQYAVLRMQELSLIDDLEYARRYAEILITEKSVSPRQAPYLMAQKGIDTELARQVIEERDDDPKSGIRDLIERRYKAKLGEQKGINSVISALARKGYSFSDIRAVLREYNDTVDEFGDF